ncbi:MAG: tetratricopeptide repeat protein [Nitrospirota bacterium]|nr:tetratricopeptide repeat protein [Nitrospirota bacterium]
MRVSDGRWLVAWGLLVLLSPISPLSPLSAFMPMVARADTLGDAQLLVDDQRYAEAVALLEKTSAAHPDNPRVWFLLGVAYTETGRPEDAARVFRTALERDPAHTMARYNLAALDFQAGRWDEAASGFLQVGRETPKLAAATALNAGLARYRQGRTDEARQLFQLALSRNPGDNVAKQARLMLAVLDGTVTAARAPRQPASRGRGGDWNSKLALGREFDSNVLATPDDQVSSNVADQRLAVNAEVTRATRGHSRRNEARYALSGYWYDDQSHYNLASHSLRLRTENRVSTLRTRLEYGYNYTTLGNSAYLANHTLGGRWTLSRSRSSSLFLSAALRRYQAPTRYDYLSGNEARLGLAHSRRVGEGNLYGALTLRWLDRADRRTASSFVSYSYRSVEPYVALARPLAWGFKLDLSLRYQYRVYNAPDTWTLPAAGRLQRRDQRLDSEVAISHPLGESVDLQINWQREQRLSNLGNRPTDYVNRDYRRSVYGVTVSGSF